MSSVARFDATGSGLICSPANLPFSSCSCAIGTGRSQKLNCFSAFGIIVSTRKRAWSTCWFAGCATSSIAISRLNGSIICAASVMFFARIRAALRPVSVRLALWLSLLFLIVVIAVNSLVYVVLKEGAETQEENNILFRLDQYSAEYRRGGLAAVEALPDIRRDRLQIAFFVRLAAPDNRTLYLRDPEDWEDFHPARLQKM